MSPSIFNIFLIFAAVAKRDSLSTYRIFSFVKSNESKTAGVIKDRPNIAVNFLFWDHKLVAFLRRDFLYLQTRWQKN